MSLITIPSSPPAPASLDVVLVNPASMVRSPFTGQQSVFSWGTSWLECQAYMPALTNAQAQLWFAFFAALKGPANTFQFTAAFVAAYPWLLQSGSPLTTIVWRLKSSSQPMSLLRERVFGVSFEAIQAL